MCWSCGTGLAPGDAHASEAHSPGTREQILVLHGTVLLEVGSQGVELVEGDAASFSGDESHSYAARHDGEGARFTLSVLQPDVDSLPRPLPLLLPTETVADRSRTEE